MSPSSKKRHSNIEKSYGIHVPLDLTVEILSRLPVKSTVRFQCVSKLWSSLIADSIMTWSLAKPRLLVVFKRSLLESLESSVFSLSGCLLSTNKTSISTKHDSISLDSGFLIHTKSMYQYTRGLICCLLSHGHFVIHNPTTGQSLLLPKIKREERWCIMDGLFGYDPINNQYKVLCFVSSEAGSVSCQVFTLGDPKKQWRNILGFERFISTRMSSVVCINGKIYFRVNNYVLMSFDVRSETLFDHGEIPECELSYKMTLVNYQGKLGCIRFKDKSAEMWVMEHQTHKQQEWSKLSLFMFSRNSCLLKSLKGKTSRFIAGVTLNGEVVIMAMASYPPQTLYAYFCDLKKKKTRRVELESTFEEDCKYQRDVCIFCTPNHVENPMSLLDSFT